MLLCVITPSTGDPRVLRAIKSVDGQGIRHMIVADGPEAALKLAKLGVVASLCLPEAVGKHGWNAHRVYGALPWLTNMPTCPHSAFTFLALIARSVDAI